MSRYLRAATVVLTTVLVAQHGAGALCEASCRDAEAAAVAQAHASAKPSEEGCHSGSAPNTPAGARMGSVDLAHCNHGGPSRALTRVRQQDGTLTRHLIGMAEPGVASFDLGFQTLAAAPLVHTPPGFQLPSLALPLRI